MINIRMHTHVRVRMDAHVRDGWTGYKEGVFASM
jgi:hypothetical protein